MRNFYEPKKKGVFMYGCRYVRIHDELPVSNPVPIRLPPPGINGLGKVRQTKIVFYVSLRYTNRGGWIGVISVFHHGAF